MGNGTPTYAEINKFASSEVDSETQDLASCIALNDIFIRSQGKLAGEFSSRWNKIYPSLLNSYEKLKKLGLIYQNGQIIPVEE